MIPAAPPLPAAHADPPHIGDAARLIATPSREAASAGGCFLLFGSQQNNAVIFVPRGGTKIFASLHARLVEQGLVRQLIRFEAGFAPSSSPCEEERLHVRRGLSMEKLIDYRVDMLKQDIKDQKDALSKKLDYLKEFYDKQKEMLQDQYDEEKYLKDQADKRKDVTDIQSELSMLENDDRN